MLIEHVAWSESSKINVFFKGQGQDVNFFQCDVLYKFHIIVHFFIVTFFKNITSLFVLRNVIFTL